LRSPEPVSLRPSHKGDICDKCREAGYSSEVVLDAAETDDLPPRPLAESENEWLTECGKEVAYFQGPVLWCEECWKRLREGEFPCVCEPWDYDSTPPEQRYDELLRAARVLLEAGVTDDGKIIPTLAFAARFWEMPYFRRIRDEFIAASDEYERWFELRDKFINSFGPFLEVLKVVNGVLVLRQVPIRILNAVNEAGVTEEISIDVFRRSARPKDVSKLYEESLRSYGIPFKTDRGDISYKAYANYIRLMARPENRTIDLAGKHTVWPELETLQQPFPPPRIIESLYEGVRGSMDKKKLGGFVYVLGGKERGPDAEPDNLIPACVAWYIGARGRLNQQHELKPKVAKVLNERLLRPCGKDTLPETGWDSSQQIWRNAKRWSQAILRIDYALRDAFGSLGLGTSDKFF
jgi:hypothetical protein